MSSNELIVIGFIIGIIAYVTLYFGKGIQKYGIEGIKEDKSVKSKHSGVWIFGTILTAIYLFIQWLALFFAPINIIAPLEGIGLITLIIFSYYVLKEDITQKEIIGIALIIIGTVFITLFNLNPGTLIMANFNQFNLIVFIVIITILTSFGITICALNGFKGAGFIIGTSAGAFMACQTVTKRITALPDPTITSIYIVLVMIFAILSLGVTQFAFAKAKANRVLPCFTSASIILATIFGAFAMNELIHYFQIIGIIIIIIGIIFLTAFRKEEKK